MRGNWLRRAQDFMIEYAYGVTLCAILAVVVGCAMYTQALREERGMQAAAGAPEVEESAEPTPTVTPVPLATAAPMALHAASPARGEEALWPVDGGILRGYDEQTPVYWQALGCAQVHDGLDIAGEAEQTVLCAAEGTVVSAARDALWGWRVAVAQDDGQRMVYAGLLQIAVDVGQRVARGQALGLLMAAIPCEGEMGAHLHVELTDETGAKKDPADFLPDRQ